jgi:hypothetical protein
MSSGVQPPPAIPKEPNRVQVIAAIIEDSN